MNRTLGYWIEKALGYACGMLLIILTYRYFAIFSFIYELSFLDKVISISSTLFGFLLAILTLLIQGNSATVNKMRLHGSYTRLINFNQTTVIAAIFNCILSLLLTFSKDMILNVSKGLFKILAAFNVGIFGCVLTNTVLFTLIFYKIVIADHKHGR